MANLQIGPDNLPRLACALRVLVNNPGFSSPFQIYTWNCDFSPGSGPNSGAVGRIVPRDLMLPERVFLQTTRFLGPGVLSPTAVTIEPVWRMSVDAQGFVNLIDLGSGTIAEQYSRNYMVWELPPMESRTYSYV